MVKKVVAGQEHVPSLLGVARVTQEEHLVALVQIPQPEEQATHSLLALAKKPSRQTQIDSGSLITLFLEAKH